MNNPVIFLPLDRPLRYHLTGKFAAPNAEWTHQDAALTDYELIVMTQGVLYLEYNGERYTVPTGHYLLLPPCEGQPNMRHGFQPSDCEFYWLHFATAENEWHKSLPPPIIKTGLSCLRISFSACQSRARCPCRISWWF